MRDQPAREATEQNRLKGGCPCSSAHHERRLPYALILTMMDFTSRTVLEGSQSTSNFPPFRVFTANFILMIVLYIVGLCLQGSYKNKYTLQMTRNAQSYVLSPWEWLLVLALSMQTGWEIKKSSSPMAVTEPHGRFCYSGETGFDCDKKRQSASRIHLLGSSIFGGKNEKWVPNMSSTRTSQPS